MPRLTWLLTCHLPACLLACFISFGPGGIAASGLLLCFSSLGHLALLALVPASLRSLVHEGYLDFTHLICSFLALTSCWYFLLLLLTLLSRGRFEAGEAFPPPLLLPLLLPKDGIGAAAWWPRQTKKVPKYLDIFKPVAQTAGPRKTIAKRPRTRGPSISPSTTSFALSFTRHRQPQHGHRQQYE